MLKGGRGPQGVERYLAPAERVVYVCRRHLIGMAGPFGLWILSLVAAAGVGLLVSPRLATPVADRLAGWLVLAASAYLALRAARWWMARYVITDQRVLLVEGIVSRTVSAIPLAKVTDTTYERSIGGRLLGYGDLMLDSPGERPGLAVLTSLPRPDELYRLIMSLVVARLREGRSRVPEADETGPIPRVIP